MSDTKVHQEVSVREQPAKTKKNFCIRIETDVILSTDEIWPDGDAPENPTAADVEKLIDETCGWDRVVSEWNLGQDCDVIEVKPLRPPAKKEAADGTR